MLKKLFVFIFVVSCAAFAQEEAQPPPEPPLDPEYNGEHGFVLMEANYKLYVSNLPKYRIPHNAQILYTVGAKDTALVLMVRDADMVTVKTDRFNLDRLMRGHKGVKVNADIYMGHFERGGFKVRENFQFEFDEQLYFRKLHNLDPPTLVQKYDEVRIGRNERILIHQIQSSPSYDHIVHFDPDQNCITEFRTSTMVPSPNELFTRLTYCGPMKQFHYEFQEFN